MDQGHSRPSIDPSSGYQWEAVGTWEQDTTMSSFPEVTHINSPAALYPSPPGSLGSADRTHSLQELTESSLISHGHSLALSEQDVNVSIDTDVADRVVSVSTSFCPGSHPTEGDVVFSSKDDVLFYVHSDVIKAACPEAFSSFLPLPSSIPGATANGAVIKIPEDAMTLNVILHLLYGTSCAPNSPSIDQLVHAIDSMPGYGITPSTFILPQTPLYTLLLSHVPHHPIQIYALAAHHKIEQLASQTSSHLLAFQLSNVTDEMAMRMGPVYLKRLVLLQAGRLEALKGLLLQPPGLHAPVGGCGFEEQRMVTRAWALASASLVWDARPDISTHRIQAAFMTMLKDLECQDCEASVTARLRDVMVKWSALKCTV
ncbi:hypothetical protein CC2G_014121 [Coprinopsis cinerea AmutBmut pab1-1]|nr:hypothetical protein CC2G_014121 [Coprinopsis cinerea AmutBmut pab1-1]